MYHLEVCSFENPHGPLPLFNSWRGIVRVVMYVLNWNDECQFVTESVRSVIAVPSAFLSERCDSMADHLMRYASVSDKPECRTAMLKYRQMSSVDEHLDELGGLAS